MLELDLVSKSQGEYLLKIRFSFNIWTVKLEGLYILLLEVSI